MAAPVTDNYLLIPYNEEGPGHKHLFSNSYITRISAQLIYYSNTLRIIFARAP